MTKSSLWNMQDLTDPHVVSDKAGRVQAMFSAIADSYDLNNRLHSLCRDQAWRRTAVTLAELKPGEVVLDVACGTGDFAMAFAQEPVARVIGVDFTYNMLVHAVRKRDAQKSPLRSVGMSYHAGDAMRLPLGDGSVDVVSIAFGIRNVADPAVAIREFMRVLRPGGRVVILEFGLPANVLLRAVYKFYFTHIMPRTASWIAGDRSGAYRYLPRSVSTFLDRRAMAQLMIQAGLTQMMTKSLTLGIAVVYRGLKPAHRNEMQLLVG